MWPPCEAWVQEAGTRPSRPDDRNGRVCARPSESSGEGCVAGLPGLAACECGFRVRLGGGSRGSAPALSPPCEADAAQRTPRPGGLGLP